MDRLCSLCQSWRSVNGEQTMLIWSALGVRQRIELWGSMNGGQTMLTLSAFVVSQRRTNFAHFVSVGGPSKVNKLCSLCQSWGSVNSEQAMLILSALGARQR